MWEELFSQLAKKMFFPNFDPGTWNLTKVQSPRVVIWKILLFQNRQTPTFFDGFSGKPRKTPGTLEKEPRASAELRANDTGP